VEQQERLGTGHAVLQALPHLDPGSRMLVLYGDVPLIEPATLAQAMAAADDALVLLTMEPADPYGFGRILRDDDGAVTGIVEERDATPEQRTITEVNSGVMAMPVAPVAPLLEKIRADNEQKEYLLTDLVALALEAGCPFGLPM
jgi:bifunctional UDP-N-acetylglucosamine pyrophosphorylase / glucosamine-1-phosphate N-acetyltransferase